MTVNRAIGWWTAIAGSYMAVLAATTFAAAVSGCAASPLDHVTKSPFAQTTEPTKNRAASLARGPVSGHLALYVNAPLTARRGDQQPAMKLAMKASRSSEPTEPLGL